ncbi:MAG TPA: 2-hydroxyglutaryl-CoA dehydratase [Verrucomicrobia bacterium]|nr:2-hydroxyglutaryl-CoA dehydratase [Verrucomicrobiota bacterium]
MITAGLDIGSTTSKAVLYDGVRILGTAVIPNLALPSDSARCVFDAGLLSAGLDRSRVEAVAATGYGRRLAGFGDLVVTEIKACALGVGHAGSPHGPIRTVLDLGGQDTKVIAIGDQGEVQDFAMNDKCAAGTGRFLELLARKLDLTFDEFVQAALRSENPVHMNSTCAVFAESEVVSLLARGISKDEIAAGAHQAIAERIGAMVRRVGQQEVIAFVGGGALNQALARSVEESLNRTVFIPDSPQTLVALGAAIAAFGRSREGVF